MRTFFTGNPPSASSGGGGGGSGDVVGPASSTDNALARFDGTTGELLQDGVVTVSDAGAVAGVTQLDVDFLRLDGRAIKSTDTNGDIVIDPDGSGRVAFGGQTSTDPALVLLSSFAGSPALRVVAADFSAGGGIIGAIVAVPSDTAPAMWMNNGNIEFGSGGQLMARDGTNLLTATQDTGMGRAAGGVWLDTNGGAGLGARLTGRVVEASTAGSGAPNLLTVTESGKLISNEGAGAEAYNTLPLAPGGAVAPIFRFYCQNANGIRITANTGDTIRLAGTASATAGFIRSTAVGSFLVLEAINATEWVATSHVGTWSIDA